MKIEIFNEKKFGNGKIKWQKVIFDADFFFFISQTKALN